MEFSTVMLSNPSNKYESVNALSNLYHRKKEYSPPVASVLKQVESICKIFKKPGVYTSTYMSVAGFEYTGDGDTARCNDCRLEVSNWTVDMKPFSIHSERSPQCPFIRSKITSLLSELHTSWSSSTTVVRNTSVFSEQQNSSARIKILIIDPEYLLKTLREVNSVQEIRRRTFSHWPHRTTPSRSQMIEAGFFHCNVGDRVICIYCNLICQQWTPNRDDPCEVHKTFSPNCAYVKAIVMRHEATFTMTDHQSSMRATTGNQSLTTNNLDRWRRELVPPAANDNYYELPQRHASFATWPHENLPSVDDLVRAGFFYTGTKTIVTCFYCNGSLENWVPNDNPMIEHARWFPHCAYAKQLCGDEMHRKIQESIRVQQDHARANEAKVKANSGIISNPNVTTNSRQLLIPDESTLSRLVAARLDLPISKSLLDRNFKLSIIKRCWEDQLRLKRDDFVSECDLLVACLILQKQIEYIDGKKENIVIPSIKMTQIIGQNEERMREQTLTSPETTQSVSNTTGADTATSSQSLTNEIASPTTNDQNQSGDSTSSNICVLCLTEEKRLGCIPCGHLVTCVPCGGSLRSCPICRREIEAFVRIYI